MSTFDLIIRGGTVVWQDGESVTDICIADGKIAALDPKGGAGLCKPFCAGKRFFERARSLQSPQGVW